MTLNHPEPLPRFISSEPARGELDPRAIWLDWPMAWSYDPEVYDFDDLQTHLWNASKTLIAEAQSRIQDGSPAGGLIAAIAMGSGVELIAKSFLVGISPGLIAAQGDYESTLIFAGEIEYMPSGARARTRVGKEALDIARKMIETKNGGVSPWTLQDQNSVLEARNAAAHLGLLREGQDTEFMAAGLRILEQIVQAMPYGFA